MFNTAFHHPFTVDQPTLDIAQSEGNVACLTSSVEFGERVHFLKIDPAEFTHAYALLGASPLRFTTDLTLYLSTVRAYFERSDCTGGIEIPGNADSDAKKRLSEDLGVALSSKFMVSLFGLSWASIAQIPQNNKLSKKRPDFIGFTPNDTSFIFESKGTTVLSSIEKQLSKAISQVKEYPVQARSKIAIVSFLAADKRFFPSSTFVVDPPFPDIVTPDVDSARLLHGEKILQFLGLQESAAQYLDVVAHKFRLKDGEQTKAFDLSLNGFKSTLKAEMREEELEVSERGVTRFRKVIGDGFKAELSFEVSAQTFSGLQEIRSTNEIPQQTSEVGDGFVESQFADGTTLRITIN